MIYNKTYNASRNIVYGIALKVYQLIFPFLMRSFIVYTLGVQFLGLNSLFTSILSILNLSELGVGSAMVYSMYKPIAQGDADTVCAMLNLYKKYYYLIGSFVLVLGLILTPFIPSLISGDVPYGINIYVLYLLNLTATVMTYWLLAYKNSVLQASQRQDLVSKVNILTDTVKYILQIVSLFAFKNYYLYVISILITQALSNIVVAFASTKLFPNYIARGELPKNQIKEINFHIKDLFTSKFGGTIVGSADTIVISAFLGLTTLAIYQNYYYIMTAVVGIILTLFSACRAGIGNSIITDRRDKVYCDFKTFYYITSWISGVSICCFLNLYQPFMKLWMGEENLLSDQCVFLLCIYFYLYILDQFLSVYKDSAGIWHRDRFRPLISAIVNLTLNIILVQYIGIFAIILSTVLSFAFIDVPWLIINIFESLFRGYIKDYLVKMIKFSIPIVPSAVVSYFLCSFITSTTIFSLLGRFFISTIIPVLVFVIFLRRENEFTGALNIFNKITKYRFRSNYNR